MGRQLTGLVEVSSKTIHFNQTGIDTGVTHLSVSVTKCDGDDEALQAVEDDVEVLVSGLPLAVRVFLRPVVFQIRVCT